MPIARIYLDGAWRPRTRDPRIVLGRRVHARTRKGGWRWKT